MARGALFMIGILGFALLDGVVDRDPGSRPPTDFLLRYVNLMSCCVDSETVDFLFHRQVTKFAEMLRILFLEDGNSAAVTGHIDAPQPGIVSDDVAASAIGRLEIGL